MDILALTNIEAPYLLASSALCPNFYDFIPLEPKLFYKLIQYCFKSFDQVLSFDTGPPFSVESSASHVMICYQEFGNWLPIITTHDSIFHLLHLTDHYPFIVPPNQLRQRKILLKCKELVIGGMDYGYKARIKISGETYQEE